MLRNLGTLFNHGRLGGTGYVSILPVDQGIEHSAAASFSKSPVYFDPLNLLELALAGECSAVATTLGTLGPGLAQVRAPDPLHREAEPQRVPARARHLRPDHVRHRCARRPTSARSASAPPSTSAPTTWTASSSRWPRRSPRRTGSGMFTVLWCYLRNSRLQEGRRQLRGVGRPDRPGQPHGRHHRGRHHQAEAAGEQRRLHGDRLRQDRPARLRRAHDRQPDRPHPLAGRQLLRRPHRPHQLGRRVQGRRATWPRPCAPPSSTSAPAAWA